MQICARMMHFSIIIVSSMSNMTLHSSAAYIRCLRQRYNWCRVQIYSMIGTPALQRHSKATPMVLSHGGHQSTESLWLSGITRLGLGMLSGDIWHYRTLFKLRFSGIGPAELLDKLNLITLHCSVGYHRIQKTLQAWSETDDASHTPTPPDGCYIFTRNELFCSPGNTLVH